MQKISPANKVPNKKAAKEDEEKLGGEKPELQ